MISNKTLNKREVIYLENSSDQLCNTKITNLENCFIVGTRCRMSIKPNSKLTLVSLDVFSNSEFARSESFLVNVANSTASLLQRLGEYEEPIKQKQLAVATSRKRWERSSEDVGWGRELSTSLYIVSR